ncbi:alcohol dehydrogenase catalytic domain-containing protein [Paeniglutamicibacter sp. ZC-3]|uniref:alcohol dehydrogenase catalytic domain-containing protein n=1 Tax=Paeniglutamicibacter TaxID=1742990 RepID=UPI0021F7E81F|nr:MULTISPECIES: alcohol dehydrogenase catalytic domain-containing protein [Paeniglutamicibacter]MCV9994423.1 alcohol dehydrogenase catalytic domain-containing protein [Paeniglutamicibacter sp. ZC-3]MDO2936078.1 alcohol dehydrogenase catalytic domain-containing protein [Paeniglutamicibacter sulfureus]
MKALTWQGKRKIEFTEVPDPCIEEPGDIIIKVTSSAICGSDLHLYELLGPYMHAGDVVGHEPMGIVEEIGSSVSRVKVGDRVVIPFNISCGSCWMCDRGLQSQCEVTQVRSHNKGAAFFGYSELYGRVPGGQAEYLRVPHADYGAIVVGKELPDHRYLFLSDILPTAWQGVAYADVPQGGTLAVFGLGPVGQLAARIGTHLGQRVIGVDPVPERRAMAERHGIETMDFGKHIAKELLDATGRGPDAVLDAVGMEAHDSPGAQVLQQATGLLPDKIAKLALEKVSVDRTAVLHAAVASVRRGGTISLSGVYSGAATPMPMLEMFDKQIQLRQGQCNVRHWTEELLPLAEDTTDPLGLDDLVTHTVPLDRGPELYETFQKKQDGCIKVVLQP